MKPVDVKSTTYVDFNKENNKEYPIFEVGNYVRIPKYENMFAKVYARNCYIEIFVIKNVKNTVLWTYVISNLNTKNIVETFCKR